MNFLYALLYIAALGILSHFVARRCRARGFRRKSSHTARRSGKRAARSMKSSA